MSKYTIASFFLLLNIFAGAQGTQPEMADALRENGKIYVVIGVIVLIFLALAVFLVFLERKIRKIEHQMKNAENK